MICKVDGDEMAEYTPYNPDVVEGMQVNIGIGTIAGVGLQIAGFRKPCFGVDQCTRGGVWLGMNGGA